MLSFYIAQYNAWCLNNGDHETPKRSYVNWNAELIWKMRTELAYQWDLLEDEIPIVFEKLLQSIKRPLLNLKSFIRGKSGKAPQNLEGITNPHWYDQNKNSFSH
jgi:hypothetical protein